MNESGRKTRRKSKAEPVSKKSSKNKKQFWAMVISIAIAVFITVQTVYLFKYTLGQNVNPDKLKTYTWIKSLLNNEQIVDEK